MEFLNENGQIYFEINGLSDLPLVGDFIEFQNEDGPYGVYRIIQRNIEKSSMRADANTRVIFDVDIPYE
jgi:hypothetical protein